jgi:hypothetical protein
MTASVKLVIDYGYSQSALRLLTSKRRRLAAPSGHAALWKAFLCARHSVYVLCMRNYYSRRGRIKINNWSSFAPT